MNEAGISAPASPRASGAPVSEPHTIFRLPPALRNDVGAGRIGNDENNGENRSGTLPAPPESLCGGDMEERIDFIMCKVLSLSTTLSGNFRRFRYRMKAG